MGKKRKRPTSSPGKKAFKRAQGRAEETGETLCATLDPEGKPIYFTMPRDADVQEVADAAFVARYGHLPTEEDRFLMNMVGKRMARRG